MRGRFGIESIHGIRSTENNHRDKLRDCENFIGIESIHGIRSTENNHRDKLRDCENFLGTESIHGIQKITIGISYEIATNVLSGKTELKNPIGDTHCWYWIHSVASELAKTQCM